VPLHVYPKAKSFNLCLSELSETLSDLKNNSRIKLNVTSPVDGDVNKVETSRKLAEDKYTPADEKPSIFSDIFSDSDHDDDVKQVISF
jgi:hypothetical protein